MCGYAHLPSHISICLLFSNLFYLDIHPYFMFFFSLNELRQYFGASCHCAISQNAIYTHINLFAFILFRHSIMYGSGFKLRFLSVCVHLQIKINSDRDSKITLRALKRQIRQVYLHREVTILSTSKSQHFVYIWTSI